MPYFVATWVQLVTSWLKEELWEMAEDGWALADTLAKEGDWGLPPELGRKRLGTEKEGRAMKDGVSLDERGHGGIVTTTLGDGFEGPDEHPGGRDDGDTGRNLIRLDHSGGDESLHHAEKLWAVLFPFRPPLERKQCKYEREKFRRPER